jgi:hypothetical protein
MTNLELLSGHGGNQFLLDGISRQCFVAAIAERRIFGVLALAKIECFFLSDFEFQCLESRAFVRAIAEGLIGTATTRAPPMSAWFYFEC